MFDSVPAQFLHRTRGVTEGLVFLQLLLDERSEGNDVFGVTLHDRGWENQGVVLHPRDLQMLYLREPLAR